MTVDQLQRVMKTLGDPTRLRILALLEREELAVQDLVRILGAAQSTVSRHLAVLRDHGLLRERREGSWSYSRFVAPRNGPWRGAWELTRDSLRDDPQVARDLDALEAVLRERTVGRREFFDSLGGDWDRLRQVFQDDLQRARAIQRLVPRGVRVADIGTGTGILALELARLGIDVIAIDHSRTMLGTAAAKVREAQVEGVEFRHGDATSLPLASGEVDAVLAHMVLHYVASPTLALREMARVVRPGGRVVVVDFAAGDADRPASDREWMRKDLGVLWQGFPPQRVREWMQEAGLIDVEIELQASPSPDRDLPATFIASANRTETET